LETLNTEIDQKESVSRKNERENDEFIDKKRIIENQTSELTTEISQL